MKTTSWICWLLAVCVCLSEAKNKIRRPLPPLYSNAMMMKKLRPIGHRISMGNAIYIGGNFPYQRVPHKHVNHRIRRPAVYNVLPSASWKNQIPIRAVLNNRAILPQRVPIKEFHSVNKIPEYSQEYRPELVVLPTHRGGVDDDKGPIHTIPAPNLSPADKPYSSAEGIADRRPYLSDFNYHTTAQNPIGLATIGNSLPSQTTAASSSPKSQHQYEVTESNDAAVLKQHPTVQSATLQPQSLDLTRLYSTVINPNSLQSNELFANHPVSGANAAVTGPNVQFGQSSAPMQTNIHGSLHVGLPSHSAVQTPYTIVQQIPDLHVGHPAAAGPPLSATQLYELLNSFPQKLTEHYSSDQQHVLQQQLGQIFQPDAVTSFSQPQMHSFNYDEQANQLQQQQQQQQQISLDQDYASDSVTPDYNLNLESSLDVIRKQNGNVHANEKFIYPTDVAERSENNIEYEETRNPTAYLKNVGDSSTIATKFYTTLPNREAAEKLAALAAAGNVNSRLIGQLRKQQGKNTQKDEPMPPNHKNDNDSVNQEQVIDDDQQQKYDQSKLSHHKSQQQRRKQNYKVQNNEKLPLKIMVLDEGDYVTTDDRQSDIRKDSVDVEYEYENDDGEIEDSLSSASYDGRIASHDNNSGTEFGTRLRPKTKK